MKPDAGTPDWAEVERAFFHGVLEPAKRPTGRLPGKIDTADARRSRGAVPRAREYRCGQFPGERHGAVPFGIHRRAGLATPFAARTLRSGPIASESVTTR